MVTRLVQVNESSCVLALSDGIIRYFMKFLNKKLY
jgi:hypothetical protein